MLSQQEYNRLEKKEYLTENEKRQISEFETMIDAEIYDSRMTDSAGQMENLEPADNYYNEQ